MKEILKEQEKRKGLIAAICAGRVSLVFLKTHGERVVLVDCSRCFCPFPAREGLCVGISTLGDVNLVSFQK